MIKCFHCSLSGTCQHVAAILFSLVHFTQDNVEKIPEGITCTDTLCEWIRPAAGQLSGLPQSALGFLKTQKVKRRCHRSSNLYDPRAEYDRKLNEKSVETFFASLKKSNPSCAAVSHFEPVSQNIEFSVSAELQPVEDTCLEHSGSPELAGDGPQDIISDLAFQTKVQMYISINYPVYTEHQQKEIEFNTRGQGGNPVWHEQRQNRLTASSFGRFSKLSVSPDRLLLSLLYKHLKPTTAMGYGLKMEDTAARHYVGAMTKRGNPVTVRECGLFVDTKNSFLAATPDRIVTEETTGSVGLLEIKCPWSKKGQNVKDVLENKENKNFFLKSDNGRIFLKRTHDYYYQLQGCMAITGYKWCDFFVFLGDEEDQQFFERIEFDERFWNGDILPSLQHFLKYAYVPEKILEHVKHGKSLYLSDTYLPYRKRKTM